jgi:hypothetical protein
MKRTQVKRELRLRRREIKTLQAPQLENVTGGKGGGGWSTGGGGGGGGGTYTCGGGSAGTKYCGTF